MTAVKINPMKLPATPWVDGYVLDYHTISSTPTGDPYYKFDTKRTELGELLYQVKYRGASGTAVTDIVDTAEQFLQSWKPPIDGVVTVPPSLGRKTQPTVEIARELAKRLGVVLCENAVAKVKPTPPMKNIDDWSERQRVLAEAVQRGVTDVKGKSILLFDDLIQSGSTLRRAVEVLLNSEAAAVYALVLTRTK